MQRCHLALAILLDNLRLDDQWNPVVTCCFPRFESEHGKASWKTGNTTKDGLKGFGEVMGYKILEDLDGRYPRLAFVGYPCFTTNPHDHLVVMHAVDEVFQRRRKDFSIRIDLNA